MLKGFLIATALALASGLLAKADDTPAKFYLIDGKVIEGRVDALERKVADLEKQLATVKGASTSAGNKIAGTGASANGCGCGCVETGWCKCKNCDEHTADPKYGTFGPQPRPIGPTPAIEEQWVTICENGQCRRVKVQAPVAATGQQFAQLPYGVQSVTYGEAFTGTCSSGTCASGSCSSGTGFSSPSAGGCSSGSCGASGAGAAGTKRFHLFGRPHIR